MCTTENTVEFMTSGEYRKSTNKLQKLLMLEFGASLNEFIKEAKIMFENSNDWLFKQMIGLIIRKYLIVNKSIEFKEKQRIIDIFFSESSKKRILLETLKK